MNILFCNIGWMDKYDGIDGDSIKRGGAYNKKSIGHEVCNFTNSDGYVYGYVQPTGQIKIEKLGANKRDEKIDGVTVVWLAGPDSGGTAVVGWYKNATIFREPQDLISPSSKHKKNGITTFRIKALWKDAFLLHTDNRSTLIPRAVKGGIGQSNVWYANTPESEKYVNKVRKLISESDENIHTPDIDQEIMGIEGNPRFISHIRRERDSKIVKAKKRIVLEEKGHLRCEVCNFDFFEFYGEDGYGFCEVHHLIPLHKSDGATITKLSDLAIVCSNCHRIIHRTTPMVSLDELSRKINQRKS
ncbi:HNH endonuclease [Samsonia erythrinae]|uniref:5-methylcytosine-specific restriction protein A n=1 Tax=Samsonia erythrinae TaxID=160434 RepID=A0A4R3VT19_9GAMM|nr:HNH endonuclease [Samsonia erythrinae]TCV07122.1 5-methylcytosine-specific restriction protein A [Samsonia erythrinae]